MHTHEGFEGVVHAESPSLVIPRIESRGDAIVQTDGELEQIPTAEDPLQVQQNGQEMHHIRLLERRRHDR